VDARDIVSNAVVGRVRAARLDDSVFGQATLKSGGERKDSNLRYGFP
jgi:hypothetical protein